MASDDDYLTLQVESTKKGIDAKCLLEVIQATIAILEEINKSVANPGNANVSWRIGNASMNSPFYASFFGIGDESVATLAAFVIGLNSLNSSDVPPQHWNIAALKCANKLTKAFSADLSTIKYQQGQGKVIDVSFTIASNAAQAIRRIELEHAQKSAEYLDYGSVEGTLKGLSSLSGNDKVEIIDSLTGESISCYFRDKEIESRAREYWKSRVVIYGDITYDRQTGNRKSVRMFEIEKMRSKSELPQMSDLYGIDITRGIEPAEFIRGLRDAN